MFMFPEILPCITIKEIGGKPFEVCTMQGLDQGMGVKQFAAQYRLLDDKTKIKTMEIVSSVNGFACIHGIRCLEFLESLYMFGEIFHELTQYIVVTDTHIKTIAAIDKQEGVRVFHTFKDDDFNGHWGIGIDHCGMKILLKQEGIITCKTINNLYMKDEIPGTSDVVGRYMVRIGGKEFDTIRQIFIGNHGEVTEFYIDVNGNQILKRHFSLNLDNVFIDNNDNSVEEFELGDVFYLNDKGRICESYIVHDFVI